MKISNYSFGFLLLVSFVILTTQFGCKESEPLAINRAEANLRFWNAMPNYVRSNGQPTNSTVQVEVDRALLGSIAFRGSEIDYQRFLTGNRTFRFFTPSGAVSQELNLSFSQDIFYTVIAVDSVAGAINQNGQIGNPFGVVSINDNTTLKRDSVNTALIRFLHLSPNAPVLDVFTTRQVRRQVGNVQDSLVTDTAYLFLRTPFVRADDSLLNRTRYRYFNMGTRTDSNLVLNARFRANPRDTVFSFTPLGTFPIQQQTRYTIIARGFFRGTGENGLEVIARTEP
jgi:hypothetical protein